MWSHSARTLLVLPVPRATRLDNSLDAVAREGFSASSRLRCAYHDLALLITLALASLRKVESEKMAGPKRAAAERRRLRRSTEAPSGEPEAVRLWLLGAFKVSVGHRSIGEKEWRLKKAGSLLKLLALEPGHRLHRERAMEQLWPGLDPEAAANNLHYALHVARRTLESAAPENTASRYLTFRGELLALCPDGLLWVDVEAFERAAATAR